MRRLKIRKCVWSFKTSRDRPKSAPCPRLKNSKKTSKCQVFFYSTRKSKNFRKNYILKKNGPSGAPGPASPWRAKVSQCRKTEWGDSLGFFNIHSVAKHQKIERGKFLFSEKNLTVPKKTVRRDLWDFPTSIMTQNSEKKLKRGTIWGKKSKKKSRSAEKMKGGTLWSRPVWYVTIGTLTSYSRIFDFIYPK